MKRPFANIRLRCALFLVDRARNLLVSQVAEGTTQITIGLTEGIAGMFSLHFVLNNLN